MGLGHWVIHPATGSWKCPWLGLLANDAGWDSPCTHRQICLELLQLRRSQLYLEVKPGLDMSSKFLPQLQVKLQKLFSLRSHRAACQGCRGLGTIQGGESQLSKNSCLAWSPFPSPLGNPLCVCPGQPPSSGSRGIATAPADLIAALRQEGFPNCSVKSRSFPRQSWRAQLGNVIPLDTGKEGVYPVCAWSPGVGRAAPGMPSGLRTLRAPEMCLE